MSDLKKKLELDSQLSPKQCGSEKHVKSKELGHYQVLNLYA
jgi:hypothetical protein